MEPTQPTEPRPEIQLPPNMPRPSRPPPRPAPGTPRPTWGTEVD